MAAQVRTDLLKLPARPAQSPKKPAAQPSGDAPRFDEALGRARSKSQQPKKPDSPEPAGDTPQTEVAKKPAAGAPAKRKETAPEQPLQAVDSPQNAPEAPANIDTEDEVGSQELAAEASAVVMVATTIIEEPEAPGPPDDDASQQSAEVEVRPARVAAVPDAPASLQTVDPAVSDVAAAEDDQPIPRAQTVDETADTAARSDEARSAPQAQDLDRDAETPAAHLAGLARRRTSAADAKLELPQARDVPEAVDSLVDVSGEAPVEGESSDSQTDVDDAPAKQSSEELEQPARVALAERSGQPREAHSTLLPARESNDTAPPAVDVRPNITRQVAPQAPPLPVPRPEAEFAAANHARIVTAVRGELLPGGGTMQIRLDPPELGALQISVRMQDGVMTASFQTSSDDATKLLSHSLTHLKSMLESTGVSVEKLQVEQAPREHKPGDQSQQQSAQHDDTTARQEQQRREMLRRMWRRLAIGDDPLDMVA